VPYHIVNTLVLNENWSSGLLSVKFCVIEVTHTICSYLRTDRRTCANLCAPTLVLGA